MNNNPERLSSRTKQYVNKYMRQLRILSRSFIAACETDRKDSARAQLARLRRLADRMDGYNFKSHDRKFVLAVKGILLPAFEQALSSFNSGNWLVACKTIETAVTDTLTIENNTTIRLS
ncbi:MAG: hypothetical protein OEZ20_06305 [candidate division WOR-3 bacterium]|nr:hypothetical protein [candidate division WOR-3 bacterium]